jgi:large subunit ribosomal protein L18
MAITHEERRQKRHERLRKTVVGSGERPRLVVFRSGKHLYAQAVDDFQGKTLYALSTLSEKFRKASPKGSTVEAAKKLGELVGPELVKKGIKRIVFDRGGYQYHGRVRALAEALREAGIDF